MAATAIRDYTTQAIHGQNAGGPSSTTQRFLEAAKSFAGQPYVWGGGHCGPMSQPGGVDCSGLVTQAAYKAGLQGIGGTAADLQSQARPVPMNQLKPGDLVFVGNPAHHVGIYVGGDKVFQAYETGTNVGVFSNLSEFTSAGSITDGPSNVSFAGLPTQTSSGSVGQAGGSGGSVGSSGALASGGGQASSMALGAPSGGYSAQPRDGASPSSGGDALSQAALMDEIIQLLIQAGLSPKDAKALAAAKMAGQNLAAVATKLGIPAGQVSSVVSKVNQASQTAAQNAASQATNASGSVKSWIEQAVSLLEAHGVPASLMNANDIATIIQHESGGNPSAVNNWDSNAAAGDPSKGLMQTISSTFNSYALPGHGDIFNPIDNIIAGVRYAISRYGSTSNVPGIVSLARGGSYVGY